MQINKLQHIAFIMDGNGRAAKQKGLPRTEGHRLGVEAVRTVVKGCIDEHIKFLSVYVFSTENWKRPQEEVDFIISLVFDSFAIELQQLIKQGVKIQFIGDHSIFPQFIQDEIKHLEQLTQSNTALTFSLFFNYGARWEILQAAKDTIHKVVLGEMELGNINEQQFELELASSKLPKLDLLVRTGDEYRLSNFSLWNACDAQLYFTDVFWPDFAEKDFYDAINAWTPLMTLASPC